MAQKVLYVLTDDLDGSEATETVTFALDGSNYEIDLSEANASRFRDAMAPYVAGSRRTAVRRGRAAGGKRRTDSVSANEVRNWAVEQGLSVSARGRVPAEIREAYDRAH